MDPVKIIINACRFGISFMTNLKIFSACLVCSNRQNSELSTMFLIIDF